MKAIILAVAMLLASADSHSKVVNLKSRNEFEIIGLVASIFDIEPTESNCAPGTTYRLLKLWVTSPSEHVRTVVLATGVPDPEYLECVEVYGTLEPHCGGDETTLPLVAAWRISTLCPP